MRTFKSGWGGVKGSGLLSVLTRLDGSRPGVEGCVARIVRLKVESGELTALALGPREEFELTRFTDEGKAYTVQKGPWCYDCFESWNRMMVLRPEDGSTTDAEVTLLRAWKTRLSHEPPGAVKALFAEIFGESLHELRDPRSDPDFGIHGYEVYPLVRGVDGIVVLETRLLYRSELKELLQRVPKDWRPVMRKSVGSRPRDPAVVKAAKKTLKRRAYTAMGVLATLGMIGFGAYWFWPEKRDRLPGDGLIWPGGTEACPQLGANRTAVWFSGEPMLISTCGSGTIVCGNGSSSTECSEFGNPWPVSYPSIWNTVHEIPHEKCEVLCRSPQEVDSTLTMRLFHHFLFRPPFNRMYGPPMSPETQVQHLLEAFTLDPNCSGSAPSWQEIRNLPNCKCNIANVTCEVMPQQNTAMMHNATLTDLEVNLAAVSDSFDDYSKEDYATKSCHYECRKLNAAN
ncbi:putative transmembrane protein [Gregarina niphandrodes]|uniref:Transmembrane protein n=1 Tax=Gregarina niphandrodes TaxID=110365 RepID=A0A023AZA2_GRENI|nr:putative transmembrane protein [Gregarina niphandrodes]EZG44000.1 putative transmembrane protein [Gregarina niphandrodes]|eukprot:XP_011132853.1 putative transmembrane protein [Gregarina niphandrodes]